MRAPDWLLERYRTVEAALLAADLAVIEAEVMTAAVHKELRTAADAKAAAEVEFNGRSREYHESYDRLQNIRKHRAWVESLAAGQPGGEPK